MQGIALVGVFLRLTPFAEQAGLTRDQLLAAVRPQLKRYFGKRGGSVVDANLALIADAYDGVVDVTAAVKAIALRQPCLDAGSGRDMRIAGEPKTVGELMTGDPVVANVDTPVADAAAMMDFYRISGLPVVDWDGSPGRRHQPDRPAPRADYRAVVERLARTRRAPPDDPAGGVGDP